MSIVAIVGRPNVGKSTFFNRLIQRREAITDAVSGVTRDRHYGKSDWNGKEFSLIDTGGYVVGSDDIFEAEIDKQVELAIDEADAIIFMVDVESGVTGMDEEVAELLRKSGKPYFLAINKVDSAKRENDAVEFYSLGVEKYYTISSINGSGKDRFVVTDIAGTTRDSIDTKYDRFGFEFNLVDTAGIRKKSKVKEDLEFYSVMRSVRAIEHCDVILLVFDATRGFDGQVQNIFWLAERNNKGVVILVNKWDLIEKDNQSTKEMETYVRQQCEPYTDVPIVFISALTKQRIYKAIETAVEVYKNRTKKIKTSVLNETMLPIIEAFPPPQYKGKYVKIKYCTQLPTPYPSFAFFANLPQYVKEPYKRFIENKLRKEFDFTGVPVTIYIRKK